MSSTDTIPWLKIASLLAPLISLTASTAILSYSIFLTPPLISTTSQSSPALALKQLRPYFENGRVFPVLTIISAGLYSTLAYHEYHHPTTASSGPGGKLVGYTVAIAGCISIIPFTAWYMIPVTNNRILELDDRAKAATAGAGTGGTAAVDKKQGEVETLLKMFARQNMVRGGMMWIGAAVGLWTVLS